MTTFIADYLLGSRKRPARSGASPALRLLARLRGQTAEAPRADRPAEAASDRRPDIDTLFSRAAKRDRFTDRTSG
jgi:hypothetical protein